jgi:predicted AlkP superfamily pyrophosphatase or phosphodiesterase
MIQRSNRSFTVGFVFLSFVLLATSFVGKSATDSEQFQGAKPPPRLVVLLVVDQFIPDYLVRFRGYFTGGFKTLVEDGAVFLNAHYDHAITQTAAGHTVIATGSQPAKTGIVANDWVDYATGRKWYAVEDPSVDIVGASGLVGRSPENLKRTAIGDWLKQSDSEARVVSVSRKDRAAISLGGKSADIALWFDSKSGRFVTSSYYADQLPRWVEEFQVDRPTASFYRTWKKLLAERFYFASREDFFSAEGDSARGVFPHRLTPPGRSGSYGRFTKTPFSDEQVLALARRAVEDVGLGQDDHTDLLAISLSATDAIGHEYGPLSQEIQDHVLRVDRALGEFLHFLDESVGLKNIVIAFSADHGVLPMPEELARRGFPARRVLKRERDVYLDRVRQRLRDRLGVTGKIFRVTDVGLLLDKSTPREAGLSIDSLSSLVAAEVRELPFVEATLTRAEVRAGNGDGSHFLQFYRNNFYPDRMADVFLIYKKYYLVTGDRTGTSHGSPHDYDRQVPVIFFGKGVAGGFYEQAISVVDLAPTLAVLSGISPPEDVDGRVIKEVMLGVASR